MPLSVLGLSALLGAAHLVAGDVGFPAIPRDKSTPVQQRLALHAPDTIAVAWNTFEKQARPCVQFGLDSNFLSQKACSTSSVTYNTSRTWANTVLLSGLKPATKYFYKVQSTNSTVEHFQTGRVAGDHTPFTMNTVADMGAFGRDGYNLTLEGVATKRDMIPKIDPALKHTTIEALANSIDDYEFIIHPGDLAYADDWADRPFLVNDEPDAYEAILEIFYDQLAPVSRRKPYLVGPGNHEADCSEDDSFNPTKNCPGGQKNFSDYINRFGGMNPSVFPLQSTNLTAVKLRQKAKQLAVSPFWYSFDYGMAHIVMINTETDYENAPDGPGTTLNSGPFGYPGQQNDFLEADLGSVDREITPWVIVAGHRPFYTAGGGDLEVQVAFEHTFFKYGVDLALFGHVHDLQRFHPVFNSTVDPAGMNNPRAPMYIVMGAAGNIEGLSSLEGMLDFTGFANNDTFGYAALTFQSRTELDISFIKSFDGSVMDKSTLVKEHKERFVLQAVPT